MMKMSELFSGYCGVCRNETELRMVTADSGLPIGGGLCRSCRNDLLKSLLSTHGNMIQTDQSLLAIRGITPNVMKTLDEQIERYHHKKFKYPEHIILSTLAESVLRLQTELVGDRAIQVYRDIPVRVLDRDGYMVLVG